MREFNNLYNIFDRLQTARSSTEQHRARPTSGEAVFGVSLSL